MGVTFHFLVVFLAVVAAATSAIAAPALNHHHINLLMPHSGSGGINCLSWRLAVEVDNLRQWKTVPEACEDYVGEYMLSQYRKDCVAVAAAAYDFAASLNLTGDGKDVWIFDIDDTTLSNLPYYARPDVAFGAKLYNDTSFNEWVMEGLAPSVPGALRLYKRLLKLGFKIVFLSEAKGVYAQFKVNNLKAAGYTTLENVMLRGISEQNLTSMAYKSKSRNALVDLGYRIQGNMGDQWSDLLGTNVGARTFKVPNPMYYIS